MHGVISMMPMAKKVAKKTLKALKPPIDAEPMMTLLTKHVVATCLKSEKTLGKVEFMAMNTDANSLRPMPVGVMMVFSNPPPP